MIGIFLWNFPFGHFVNLFFAVSLHFFGMSSHFLCHYQHRHRHTGTKQIGFTLHWIRQIIIEWEWIEVNRISEICEWTSRHIAWTNSRFNQNLNTNIQQTHFEPAYGADTTRQIPCNLRFSIFSTVIPRSADFLVEKTKTILLKNYSHSNRIFFSYHKYVHLKDNKFTYFDCQMNGRYFLTARRYKSAAGIYVTTYKSHGKNCFFLRSSRVAFTKN